MIVSGQCRAFRTIDAAEGTPAQETLAVMAAGDVFGEMALILDEPRAASVEAVDQVTVLVLDKKTWRRDLARVDGSARSSTLSLSVFAISNNKCALREFGAASVHGSALHRPTRKDR